MGIQLIRNDDNTVTLKDSEARTLPDGGFRTHVKHVVTYNMETWMTLASTLIMMAAADESELAHRRAGREPQSHDARRHGARNADAALGDSPQGPSMQGE